MHKALNLRDSMDTLNLSRKEGERRLTSIQDNMEGINWRTQRAKKKKRIITAARNSTNIKTNKIIIASKQKQEEKQLFDNFKRQIGEISHDKT